MRCPKLIHGLWPRRFLALDKLCVHVLKQSTFQGSVSWSLAFGRARESRQKQALGFELVAGGQRDVLVGELEGRFGCNEDARVAKQGCRHKAVSNCCDTWGTNFESWEGRAGASLKWAIPTIAYTCSNCRAVPLTTTSP